MFDEKCNTYVLNFYLEGCHNEAIRLWSCGLRSSSPSVHSIYSETDSEAENDDSKFLTSYIEKLKQCRMKCQN